MSWLLGHWESFSLVAVQFVLFLRWLYRRMRDDEISRVFVRDMATVHLPTLYKMLHEIASNQGIDLGDPPPIRFIELNGNGKGEHSKAWHRMTP